MNYLQIIYILLLFGISTPLLAQKEGKKVTEITFHTEGVCGMCKNRIESALDLKGIRYVNWDKETGTTTVAYQTKEWTTEKIHARLAAVGHKTDLMAADTAAYRKLPLCCHYNDGGAKH